MTDPQLGYVDSLRADGSAIIRFDGEDTPSSAVYPQIADYIPAVGDRVLLVKAGLTSIIIGRVATAPAKPAAIALPKTVTSLVAPGATYTANEQKLFTYLRNDMANLRATVYDWMSAMRAARKG